MQQPVKLDDSRLPRNTRLTIMATRVREKKMLAFLCGNRWGDKLYANLGQIGKMGCVERWLLFEEETIIWL